MFGFLKHPDKRARELMVNAFEMGRLAIQYRVQQHFGWDVHSVMPAAIASACLLEEKEGLDFAEKGLDDELLKKVVDFELSLVNSDALFRELLVRTLQLRSAIYSHDGNHTQAAQVWENPILRKYGDSYPCISVQEHRELATTAATEWGLEKS